MSSCCNHDHETNCENGTTGCRCHSDAPAATPPPAAACGCCGQSNGSAKTWLVVASGAFVVTGLALETLGENRLFWSNLAYIAALLMGGVLVLPLALRSLRVMRFDMNVLMSIAIAGAIIIGQQAEAAMVVFLFALSQWLESWSVNRAHNAIQKVLQLAPDRVLVRRENEWCEVPAGKVRVGETIAVKTGQRIALDGIVRAGASSVNQASITGESLPVSKAPGDEVYAGTMNGDGFLEVQTTREAGDTVLARIVQLVTEAQSQKAPTERLVDRFATYYTPTVIGFAIVTFVAPPLVWGASWHDWLYRALVLLVISCPCALVISTPVSIVTGLTAMARRGALIKSGAALEALGRLRALALDKTGTITEGKPRILNILPFGGMKEEQILRVAAAIDTHSTHPIAQAVVEHAKAMNIDIPAVENYRAKSGLGAEATLDGHVWFVGNHRLARELGLCSPPLQNMLSTVEATAQSVVIVGHTPHDDCQGEILGVLSVGDAMRAHVPSAIKGLKKAGMNRIVMLSGDNMATARAIAGQAGIEEVYGDLLPADKISHIKRLAKECGSAGMVGDGVNDAPALAAASVGIAMGANGSDTAVETADVTLMHDDLRMLPEAIRFARRTLDVMRINIGFSISIKAIFLAVTLLGHATLWMAVFADMGATLLVTFNALRLLRNRSSPISS